MDNNISKKLVMLLNKLPKKDLEKNLEKAKEILANSNKEDINSFLNSKPVSDLLGKDKEKITDAVKNGVNLDNLNNINSDKLK